jgi:hypothetical protein
MPVYLFACSKVLQPARFRLLFICHFWHPPKRQKLLCVTVHTGCGKRANPQLRFPKLFDNYSIPTSYNQRNSKTAINKWRIRIWRAMFMTSENLETPPQKSSKNAANTLYVRNYTDKQLCKQETVLREYCSVTGSVKQCVVAMFIHCYLF